MPFIKGRFHINPIAGQALEAAREAEAALLALEHAAQQERQRQTNGNGDGDGGDGARNGNADDTWNDHTNSANAAADGPIHRVEIEASEMVPSHQEGLPGRRLGEPGRSVRAVRGYVARVHRTPAAPRQQGPSALPASPPEMHVFADHRDLVNFLRDELAKDCQ